MQNNLIGTNENSSRAIPNGIAGIKIGENAGNDFDTEGQISQHKGNVISGQTLGGGFGISLAPLFVTGSDEYPQQNKIQGNRIGIKAFSYDLLPNTKGIQVQNTTGNFIGPDPTSDCGPNNENI